MDRFQITKQGYEKLKAEIEHLKNVERPKIIKQIADARELGDLRENAEYHTAKDRQGFVEAQLADLEEKFSRVEIIDVKKISGKKIQFGATVTLENLDNGKKISYKIVSEFEANADEGLISNISPVARALIGKEVSDEVEIRTPGGITNYEILEIKFL
ncbi:MAG: transcription elongation factor GreA [Alphaproteobacteria bacterium RIFCSPLOWO2_01_FULL_40_26]|nr:MAG: transcription elongation factor GreA [Alphaproteobacteria bacterium RIFCSPHIGHO2_02_FULL_40_34]OFW86591.1 MAG: transcription elongation factor GreA [Alphaproteobacteria bacterium RIFCSPHIGHO2_01_FULL_40_8]OFW94069.1 MAG: transcription elongation factor GreA [Alphaproteobacteria bacterium RIFCSPLOWO2_01_FULL_40_26]OFX09599.1 MAG: transcription elongation factor GreA [Alphaproteobacteria bacterium RIFCSPLOWO2_02_FULL_40_19]OFX11260.1 MAG: transcription elongation factor GreA [Alphaproteob